MASIVVTHKLTISPNEALNGTKKLLTRRGKHLEVTVPAGVKTGSLVKLSGALQITDGYYGDILIRIKVKSRRRGVLAVTAIAGLFIIIICSFVFVIGYFVNSGSTTNPTESPSNHPGDFVTVSYDIQSILIRGEYSTWEIKLIDHDDATNPTWQQLVDFLRSDKTDQNQYILNSYMCAQFARDVHNNAEAVGIRTAFVGIYFVDDIEGHALNAFETIDKGLVYIDCVGFDTIAHIEEGNEYQSSPLFETDYEIEPLGIVEAVEIYW